MNVYVASSWRNERQPHVVNCLRVEGFEVYDFREPEPGNHGFAWSEIDENWQSWTPGEFKKYLGHQIAMDGFLVDKRALDACDACVLVMPCGRSAHLELGYVIGRGKPGIVLLSNGEPELMYNLGCVCVDMDEVLDALKETSPPMTPGEKE